MKRGDPPPWGYPGSGQDAGQRHADTWPRHRHKARNRIRRRSSLRRGKQTQTD